MDQFTEDEYAELLDLAATKYRFVDVSDVEAVQGPVIVWRHDVDYSPQRALALAEVERVRGLRCVYHFMLSSRYYNALEPEIAQIVKRIASLGHYLGIHVDMDIFGEHQELEAEDIVAHVAFEKGILENLAGRALTSMSFHNYTVNAARLVSMECVGDLPNLSARTVFERFRYVSDSNGMWRYDRLRTVLSEDAVPRLMVLTHPEWWTPDAMTPYQRLERCVSGRAAANLESYVKLLIRDGRLAPIAERAGLPADLVERHLKSEQK